MDLSKFIYLLINKSLYFPSPIKFKDDDPWEGYFPVSLQKFRSAVEYSAEEILKIEKHRDNAFNQINNSVIPDKDNLIDIVNSYFSKRINDIDTGFSTDIENIKANHGVSCWHRSEQESEAMWKLYSAKGQGIAIESTISQFQNSLICDREIFFSNVVYYSDDEPENEEYYKIENLAFKRKSFSHENEYRGIVELNEDEKREGVFVNCNLEQLINRIHISPMSEPYFEEIVKEVCIGKIKNPENLVTRSKLLESPDYRITSLCKTLFTSP